MKNKEKIKRWIELKEIESSAKKERIEIEDSFIKKDKIDGKEIIENLEITYKSTFEVDQDMVKNFEKIYDKIPFRIGKYSVDKKLYDATKEMSPEAFKVFRKAVTEKPARPSFKIKE